MLDLHQPPKARRNVWEDMDGFDQWSSREVEKAFSHRKRLTRRATSATSQAMRPRAAPRRTTQ